MADSLWRWNGQGLLRSYVATSGDRAGEWEPVYSISPRTKVPVLREFLDSDGQGHRSLEMAQWGFHPSWAKEKGPRPINARLETVATNGMFRGAFTSSRAVVPMTGYYEWVETEAGKQPYFIYHPDGALLHAAGLTAAAKNAAGEWEVSFTVITREARDAGGEVHDRMPAFLSAGYWRDWLTPGKLDADEKEHIHGLLDSSSIDVAAALVTVPVDRKVNNQRTLDRRDPTLIEPITLE